MADFRKCVFAFAVLALLLGSVGTVNAQTAAFQCVANAGVPPLMRAEGITELTGDIVLNCTGGTALAGVTVGGVIPADTAVPSVNIRVFLNTAVTSRLLTDPWSESLLMIDEPPPGGPFVGCVNGATQLAATQTVCNVIQGRVVGGNSVEFLGVPVLPPGTTGTRIYRITNVRANASAVAPGGSGTPGQVVGLISATPATFGASPGIGQISPSFPINNPQQIVGFVQNGLSFAVRNAVNDDSLSTTFGFQQCVARTSRGTSGFAVLRYTEGFPTAFKLRTVPPTPAPTDFDTAQPPQPQNVPGFIYNTESGYYNPGGFAAGTGTAGLVNAGLADFSTRVRALFTNVPAGVRLFVTVREIGLNGNNRARLVGSAIGAFFPVTALSDTYGLNGVNYNAAEVPIVNGTGEAVWELTSTDPLTTGRLDFGLFATYTADVANNLPAAPSQATISGSFAPITGPTTASATAPIPRFVDISTGRNLFRINVCVTNLLFPFITNQAGFDTGLAIANTSQDPFGTPVQTGTCTLNWYGANAPAAAPTPSVGPGTVWVNTVMNLAPNFQGYMIAQCRFQYAHGFAFISDVGARNLAMGYLALVIPADADADRDADPFPNGGAGSGEQLGN